MKPHLTAGKPRVSWKGGRDNLTLPSPIGTDVFFDIDTTLTVQLLNSIGACWSTEFTPTQVKKNTARSFKAVGP